MTGAAEQAIRNILARVQSSVRKLDYEGVRDLIPDDGLYFGSAAAQARGYEALRSNQFEKVWPNIAAFTILEDSICVHADGTVAWATCLFESLGPDPDDQEKRRGRMTFVFEHREDRWVMAHSHDSLFPAAPGADSSNA